METVAGDAGPGHTTSALRLSHAAELGELRAIRNRVDGWGRAHRLPPEILIDLQLAVGEAVSNGMEHAYLGDGEPGRRPTVEVELELHRTPGGRAVAVRVTDHGRWRPVPAEPGYRGRGMGLIEQLSRDLQVQRTSRGTQVRFTIPWTD